MDKHIDTTWELHTYDVWGNATDGYEVNDSFPQENYFELAVFLMHYHSGQWSRGYRLLSRLRLSNLSSAAESEATESECYQYLVEHYAESV